MPDNTLKSAPSSIDIYCVDCPLKYRYVSNKMPIKILVLCNWTTTKVFNAQMNQQSRGADKVFLVSEDEPHDVVVIINASGESPVVYSRQNNVFYTCMEPYLPSGFGEWQYPEKYFAPERCILHKNHHNLIEWHLGYNYAQLKNKRFNGKYNKVSVIQSIKFFDLGHRRRIQFIEYIANQKFSRLDCFGTLHIPNANYFGQLPYRRKEAGLERYKYHIAAENNSIHNYFTEKIIDGILMECLVFYWGCPNLEDYLPARAFVRLEMTDPAEDFQVILKAIEEDWWAARRDSILEAKNIILDKLQFFPHLESLNLLADCDPIGHSNTE